MTANQTDRLDSTLVDGLVKAIVEKDYKAVDVLSTLLDKLRSSISRAPTKLYTVKDAAEFLGISYSAMRCLADSVPMRGAVYNVNPTGANRSLRIDIGVALRVLRAWPAGYYK